VLQNLDAAALKDDAPRVLSTPPLHLSHTDKSADDALSCAASTGTSLANGLSLPVSNASLGPDVQTEISAAAAQEPGLGVVDSHPSVASDASALMTPSNVCSGERDTKSIAHEGSASVSASAPEDHDVHVGRRFHEPFAGDAVCHTLQVHFQPNAVIHVHSGGHNGHVHIMPSVISGERTDQAQCVLFAEDAAVFVRTDRSSVYVPQGRAVRVVSSRGRLALEQHWVREDDSPLKIRTSM
jgi:hypothetical protein